MWEKIQEKGVKGNGGFIREEGGNHAEIFEGNRNKKQHTQNKRNRLSG